MEGIEKHDIEMAIAGLATIPFFPSDPMARAYIARLLGVMCLHRKALEWLVDAMISIPGPWPGLAEMRGVYCSRWVPKDGRNALTSIGQYSPDASEMRALVVHVEQKLLAGESADVDEGSRIKTCAEMTAMVRAAVLKQEERESKRLVINPIDAKNALEGLRRLGAK